MSPNPAPDLSTPPGTLPLPMVESAEGAVRRCGVEIEFAGLDAEAASAIIQRTYGGTARCQHEHSMRVEGTELGDFVVELDMLVAHPERQPEGHVPGALDSLEAKLRAAVGDVGSFVMPYEISFPPVPVDRLGEVDRLVRAIREAGAKGTETRFFYAFGLHFNPEVARRDADHIVDVMKAYLLLSSWLREEMDIDIARQVAPFVHRFTDEYAALVLNPSYRPDLPRLATDYARHNPSRNRELDMWPLLTLLAPDAMREAKADPHVRPRPTWHWRLPDSRVSEPGWSILPDWNRWVQVERLATDRWALDELGALWLDCYGADALADWPKVVRRWLPPA